MVSDIPIFTGLNLIIKEVDRLLKYSYLLFILISLASFHPFFMLIKPYEALRLQEGLGRALIYGNPGDCPKADNFTAGLLTRLGLSVDVIDVRGRGVDCGLMRGYGLVLLPQGHCYGLNETEVDNIERYVLEGGAFLITHPTGPLTKGPSYPYTPILFPSLGIQVLAFNSSGGKVFPSFLYHKFLQGFKQAEPIYSYHSGWTYSIFLLFDPSLEAVSLINKDPELVVSTRYRIAFFATDIFHLYHNPAEYLDEKRVEGCLTNILKELASPRPKEAHVVLWKALLNATLRAGRPLSLTLAIVNIGLEDAEPVELLIILPADVKLAEGDGARRFIDKVKAGELQVFDWKIIINRKEIIQMAAEYNITIIISTVEKEFHKASFIISCPGVKLEDIIIYLTALGMAACISTTFIILMRGERRKRLKTLKTSTSPSTSP